MQVVFVCVYVCDFSLFFFFFFNSARPLLLDTARPFRPRPSKRLILLGACHREAIINTRDCTPSVSDRTYHRPVARSHWRKSAAKIHARHHHRLLNTNKVMSANNNASTPLQMLLQGHHAHLLVLGCKRPAGQAYPLQAWCINRLEQSSSRGTPWMLHLTLETESSRRLYAKNVRSRSKLKRRRRIISAWWVSRGWRFLHAIYHVLTSV